MYLSTIRSVINTFLNLNLLLKIAGIRIHIHGNGQVGIKCVGGEYNSVILLSSRSGFMEQTL